MTRVPDRESPGGVPLAVSPLREERLRQVGLSALVAVVILLAASLAYALGVRGIVIVWIPSGVLLGALLSFARRSWLPILIGGFAGNLAADLMFVRFLGLSLLGPVVNVVEALAAAALLHRLVGRQNLLGSLRGVAALVVGAAGVSNAVTAILGAALLQHWYPQPFFTAWLNWWVGDGLGMLVVAPAVLGLVEEWHRLKQRPFPWRRALEALVLAGAVLVASELTFRTEPGAERFLASTYLVFPFLFLMAARLGPGASAAAVSVVAGVALYYSSRGLGPLVDLEHEAIDQAIHLYSFLGLATISVLVPAAAIAEREQAADESRANEARYRALVDAARDAIITIGTDGRIRFTNPAVEQVFGYSPQELAGRPLTDLIPEGQRGALQEVFRRFLGGEKPLPWRDVQLTAIRRDGREIPVEFAYGEWVAEGERFFTGIVRDISERRRLEEDLRHAQRLESLGHLTGGLAHEFRNELTVILANAELALVQSRPGAPHRSALEEVRAAAARGAALTRDLLTFGRRQPLQPATLDLDEVVSRGTATMRPILGRRVTVEAIVGSGRKRVHADLAALQQVLLNLMLNARDAMPEGGRLTLETGLAEVDAALAERLGLERPGRYVTLEVADTGVGMNDEAAARAFEPFYTTKPRGTGLGLSTVYGVVRQSGGAVRLDSVPGGGTTFRIYLPEAAEPGHAAVREAVS